MHSHPFWPQTRARSPGRSRSSLKPLTAVLTNRAGLTLAQVDANMVGSTADKSELMLCVQTKAKYDAAAIRKKLEANKLRGKIGKVEMYLLPDHPQFENSVAFVNPTVLLIGRRKTVEQA